MERPVVTDVGLFSPESLNVSLAFTRAAHQVASEQWLRAGKINEDLKTWAHELTHYVQATTTPYGLFLHYCRQVQDADTVEIVRALLAKGEPIARPLLSRAPFDLDGQEGATVRGGLSRWLNIELLVAQLAQDSDSYFSFAKAAEALEIELLPTQITFYRTQGAIASIISRENAGRAQRGMAAWDQGGFDVNAINAEGNDDLYWSDPFAKNIDRAAVLLDATGNIWGAESILESAATAAEWAESGASLADLRAFANDTEDVELAMYKHCLALGLDAIPADDLQQFAFSFIALCELTLLAPLLPQHAALRRGRRDPRELFPALRFQSLLGAAQHVRPLAGLADVARYNLELCARLDWVQPIQLITSAMNGPQMVADRRAQRYIWAQAERAKMQHAFTNLVRRSLDQGPIGDSFRAKYEFPVIEYTDKTLYMGDKDGLGWLTAQHVLTLAMRQIMLSKTLTIPCPYRGAAAEAEALTADLQATLKRLFDRDFPMARVVMPGAHA